MVNTKYGKYASIWERSHATWLTFQEKFQFMLNSTQISTVIVGCTKNNVEENAETITEWVS